MSILHLWMFGDLPSLPFSKLPYFLSIYLLVKTPLTLLVVETLTKVVVRGDTDKRVNRKDVKAELWESGHMKGETGRLGQNPRNFMELGTWISKGKKLLLYKVKFHEFGGVWVLVNEVLEFNSTKEQARLSPGKNRGQQSEKPLT